MAALTGATLTTHANFRQTDTVDPNFYAPAISPELWPVFTHVVGHGIALTHSVNTRGTLADTDIEAGVAELDQFTDVAPTAATQVDMTPTLVGIATPVGAQAKYFPGAGGWSADAEVSAQQAEAMKQYESEFGLDLVGAFTNSTTLGATLGRDEFITIKIALMAQNPEGTLYHSVMHTSDFGNFVTDVGSLGNPLAADARGLLQMKPQGYQGMYEGVEIFATSQIDQYDADEWQGAIVTGTAYVPGIAPMEQYNNPDFMGTGLIKGPNRMTLKEFYAVSMASLVADSRLGDRRIAYRYRGHATVNQNQAHHWRSNKV